MGGSWAEPVTAFRANAEGTLNVLLGCVAAGVHRVVSVGSADVYGVVTTSGVSVVEEEERVRELSRMLAGMEESDTAEAHARELLAAARGGDARA